jgi:hypothetical protein
MSTSETVTLDANVCPCGCGKILKHVTTQDNPWSSADISYELSCESCEADWILENTGVALVSRREAAEENSAREAWLQAGEPLRALVEELVSGYFGRFAAPSKKAEWREMQRLDIYKGSYRNFLQDKAKGGRPGQTAYGLRNRPWLAGLAEERNRQSELKQLIATWDARKDAWEQAARRVRRWPVDRPRDRA